MIFKHKESSMIYFDHNATTPVLDDVIEAMRPYWTSESGNPSSIHAAGRRARLAMDKAREKIAALLDAAPEEIIFTGGATEANNIAIKGMALSKGKGQLVTSAIEHPSVLEPMRRLEKEGFNLIVLGVDAQGRVRDAELKKAWTPETILLSMQYANNETGTIQDIGTIGACARERKVPLHVDAAQAVGKIPVSLKQLPVDFMTFSAHKFYGPKGVGGLFVRKGTRLTGLQDGGMHEKKLRPGTENVAGIVGMAAALEIVCRDMEAENQRLHRLKMLLMEKIKTSIDNVEFNGGEESLNRDSSLTLRMTEPHQLPNTINICFHGVDAQSLLMNLDLEGICVSTGSACSSGSLEPSSVLIAMKGSKELAKSSLRISLGRSNTEKEIESLARSLARAVEQVRSAVLRER